MIREHGDEWLDCPAGSDSFPRSSLLLRWPERSANYLPQRYEHFFCRRPCPRLWRLVVVPPSTLRLPDGTLGHYRWVTGFDVQPPLPPDWLVSLLLSENSVPPAAISNRHMPPVKLNAAGKVLQVVAIALFFAVQLLFGPVV